MKVVRIPWMAWYGDGQFDLTFPDPWEIEVARIRDAEDIGEKGIREALLSPIGSKGVKELAEGKGSAVIVVDDLTRPTPAHRLLPPLLEELREGGLEEGQTKIIIGLGAHRPLVREELVKKLGQVVVERIDIHNHHTYENLVDLGTSSGGTPILINRYFVEADLRIALGCILPHGGAGFGGGAKMVLPGVASLDTIEANHRPHSSSGGPRRRGLGLVEGNWLRADAEEVATIAGLDLIVNVVPTPQRGVAGLFVGDPVAAHREGVKLAREVYATPMPDVADVVTCNAYPQDTELVQIGKGLHALHSANGRMVREGGSVVLAAASTEGPGYHSLAGPGMRDEGEKATFTERGRSILFSPYLSLPDVYASYCEEVLFFQRWSEAIEVLGGTYGDHCRVVIFPYGPLQIVS